jgi:DNA polymerase-1
MHLYLIDGNSYVYRAFFAIKGLTNSKGFPTNAIYGFTNMLFRIIREKKPDGLAVFFDSAEPTERHRLFEAYKANRPETPSDLTRQFPAIRTIIKALNISIVECPGFEADDLIGTVAKKAVKEGGTVYIVTSDKDMLQLVNKHIKIYDPVKNKILDEAYVLDKFGIGPERVTEFMALTGDATDNIPGVKGIGEKTAKELLSAVKDIDELLQSPERIKKTRLRSLISDNIDLVHLSQNLATIDTSVPLDANLEDFRMREPDWRELLTLFKEFEFTRLMNVIPSSKNVQREHEAIHSLAVLNQIIDSIKKEFSFDIEATGKNALTDNIVGIAVCTRTEKAYYIPLAHSSLINGSGPQLKRDEVLDLLFSVLQNDTVDKIGHNLKYDMMMLDQVRTKSFPKGIQVQGTLFDTMIASYLLNPNKPKHGLDEVSFEYLSKRKKSFAEILRKEKTFADVPIKDATEYAAEDAALSYELKRILFGKIREQGLEQTYFDIEMPLINVLIDMEKEGIKIDTERLNDISKDLAAEIDGIQKRIFFLAGEEFNINSPKQLGIILFQRLGLKPLKKTKTGYSTNMNVLEELAGTHELPKEVLMFRSLSKLKSTYVDVFPSLINQRTGRLHTSFNQTATATGRLSSSEPNLQNIPIRGEWGKRIRQTFIAEKGNVLLSADYSQIELRILAHLSQDTGLMKAFADNLDVHARTASELYNVAFDNVTPEMRRLAKTVNFGVIYGISPFGLSETLNIARTEAEQYIHGYFQKHPGVREYMRSVVADAKKQGYVTTLSGRKRPLPDFRSSNKNIRQQNERLAINSPIQGTAADIIKIAMIRLKKKLTEKGMRAKMILQVHDELLFELPESEVNSLIPHIREAMESAVELSVPLKVDIGYGKNWADAH